MGMIAYYCLISDEELNSLKNLNSDNEDVSKKLEAENEQDEISLDLDKMWDALHFVLTGKDCANAMQGNPLSQAIVGECTLISSGDEYLAYISKSSISSILEALENFDMETAMQEFSMEKCKEADIYPDIWDYEEEAEEIQEEICSYFEQLKAFYRQILAVNGNVVVSIS